MSKYPAQIDTTATLPLVVDSPAPITADAVNRLRNVIVAIEKELGVKPSGLYTTVRARLDHLETLFDIDLISLAGDLGGVHNSPLVIGLQGNPIATTAPTSTQALVWNGIAWAPANAIQLAQDLGNTTALPKVIGLQGRTVNSVQPLLNQVLTWDGTQWIPETATNVIINVLPTSITLPVDITFLSGDGYNGTSNPTRVGSRAIDMSGYPYNYVDGRTQTLKFTADLEVTNTSATGFVRLKDITNNVIIASSTLSTNSLASVELSAIIYSGITDGYLRTDSTSMYEVQIYITGGASTDQVICRNARIQITYSSPILVTALVPLALPTDIQFVAGTTINGFTTPAGMGGRKLDMNFFNPTLPDSRARTVKFYADVEVSAPGVDGYVQLFDTTNNVLVTGTLFHFTNTIVAEVASSGLTVGGVAGNIRNDSSTRYEVHTWKVSGSVVDRVICNNARLTITYA
jgi:hypothetical protein